MIGFSVDKGEILHDWIFWHLGLIYLQDNSRRTSSSLTTDSNNGNDLSLYKRLVSSPKRKNSTLHEEAEISLMYNKNNSGPRTDPWGTPQATASFFEILVSICVVWNLPVRYEHNHLFMTSHIP